MDVFCFIETDVHRARALEGVLWKQQFFTHSKASSNVSILKLASDSLESENEIYDSRKKVLNDWCTRKGKLRHNLFGHEQKCNFLSMTLQNPFPIA